MIKLLSALSAIALSAGLLLPMASASAATCTAQLGGSCGAYVDSSIPMSNGFDTYVSPQDVGSNSGTTATLTATDAGNWSVVANATPLGYEGVQIFANTQQLTNDWDGSGWNGNSDTPLSGLSALTINYSETSPTGNANNIYEFAPDIWTEGYPSDVMFWADTQGRCNQGAYGPNIIGTATFDGQTWTVNRYGDAGAEIIFVLDSNPAVPDSCSQQTSGSIDIGAGFKWLEDNGFMSNVVFTQMNTGWEITSAQNAKFTMNSYSITAVPNGTTPTPTPTPTVTPTQTPTPTPTPTVTGNVPVATTGVAGKVAKTSAKLNGHVNPEGLPTTYQFQYGKTTAYGKSIPLSAASAGSGMSLLYETAPISGLSARTTYHFRIVATNADGTVNGADHTFKTT